MASYQTSYIYGLSPLGDDRFEIVSALINTVTAQDGTDDDVLEGTIQASGITWDYVGQYGTGWVGFTDTPVSGMQYYLFSNTPLATGASSVFTAAPEALPICFLPGTRIATPAGARAVETLAIGDAVLTAGGDTCRVRWIGRQRVVPLFADRLRAWPIRIAAGALGGGLPLRDLWLSPDHALCLGGLLVQAGALVNGGSIRHETVLPEAFDYLHVELAEHRLILAEGVPAESFLDSAGRARFDNRAEHAALYGDTLPPMQEMALPRVKSARQVPPALRRALAPPAGRAAA
ncbi:Hint domain-containing protein [Pseudoroseomonas cervicalis]|uniref:Hint domain-containing protein n=1 Tax=Teichococcus cervicalis TaxID=204525 RepID=UPI0022F15F0A|nr:Hint domain-containing protein [Pseudoroseomonas cervicalis]WBV43330.1 Hint domain-containing protein [Pseudoroseomonas cervicalis]